MYALVIRVFGRGGDHRDWFRVLILGQTRMKVGFATQGLGEGFGLSLRGLGGLWNGSWLIPSARRSNDVANEIRKPVRRKE